MHSSEGNPWSKWCVGCCGERIGAAKRWSNFQLDSKRSTTSPKEDGPHKAIMIIHQCLNDSMLQNMASAIDIKESMELSQSIF